MNIRWWALFAILAACLVAFAMGATARAQVTTKVVGTCGTQTFTAGTMQYPTQDTTGTACTTAGGGGGTSNVNITEVGGNAVTTTVPISGTVTTSPPANASINLTQVGGSAVALGSTTSSASIPVVIASDQAAVNVKQATAANLNATVVGTGTFAVQAAVSNLPTTVDTGNGTQSASTLRVTVASDSTGQVKSTNWPTTVDTNTGAAGASTPRVVLDSGYLSTGKFKLVDTGGTNVAAVNANGGQAVAGDVAAAATDSGNPVKVGGVYLSTQTAVTTGQRKDIQLDSVGNQRTEICNPNATTPFCSIITFGADAVGNVQQTLFVSGYGYAYNGSTYDRLRGVTGSAGAGLGVLAVDSVPCSNANCGTTGAVTSAVASSLVLKASAGNLYSVNVVTGASAGFVMFFNATSAPGDGAVTPVYCMPIAANSGFNMANTPIPANFTTGITIVFSTTGCFTKTASATAFIAGQFQ